MMPLLVRYVRSYLLSCVLLCTGTHIMIFTKCYDGNDQRCCHASTVLLKFWKHLEYCFKKQEGYLTN